MADSMDAEQLSMWYDSYGDRLMLYARNWLPEDSARDAVQGAFIHLMGLTLAPRDAQAWLFRTVRNEAIARLRRRERQQRHGRQIAMQKVGWF